MNKQIVISLLLGLSGAVATGMNQPVTTVSLPEAAVLISKEHEKQIKHVYFTSAGDMVTIGLDKAVVYDHQLNKRSELPWSLGAPKLVASSDHYLAISHTPKTITIYTLDLKEVATFTNQKMSFSKFCFFESDKLAAGLYDGSVVLIDIENQARKPISLRPKDIVCEIVDLHMHNGVLLVSWSDGTVAQWDGINEEFYDQNTYQGIPTIKAFASAGKFIATVSGDKTVRMWHKESAKSNNYMPRTISCKDYAHLVAGSTAGLVAVSHANGISLYNATAKELMQEVQVSEKVTHLGFVPETNKLVVGLLSGRVYVYEYDYQCPVHKQELSQPIEVTKEYQQYEELTDKLTKALKVEQAAQRLTLLSEIAQSAFFKELDRNLFETEKNRLYNAIIQTHVEIALVKTGRDRYNSLQSLLQSDLFKSLSYADQARWAREIQNELNKVWLVQSLWFNAINKAVQTTKKTTHWLSEKINNTLLKLTPILT